MDIADFLVAKRQDILDAAARHGAKNVRVFGSVARGDSNDDSDVDLLVDIEAGGTWSALESLSEELSRLLGRKVDISTERDLRPRVRRRAIEEAIPLGGKPPAIPVAKGKSRMRRDHDRLLDILEAIDMIQRYSPTVESLHDYAVESVVFRNIQIIGEAAAKLSDEMRQQHPEVPWAEIVSMRNRIVHGYWQVDVDKVKPLIERDLADLRSAIQAIADNLAI